MFEARVNLTPGGLNSSLVQEQRVSRTEESMA